MTQELEKLHTQAIADAAEIARLQSGFDELKKWIFDNEVCEEIDLGIGVNVVSTNLIINEINRITGVE